MSDKSRGLAAIKNVHLRRLATVPVMALAYPYLMIGCLPRSVWLIMRELAITFLGESLAAWDAWCRVTRIVNRALAVLWDAEYDGSEESFAKLLAKHEGRADGRR